MVNKVKKSIILQKLAHQLLMIKHLEVDSIMDAHLNILVNNNLEHF
jgi:hypothetical protein